MCSSCTFDINPVSVILFANIFFHFFVDGFLCCADFFFFSLIEFHLSIFICTAFNFGVHLKKIYIITKTDMKELFANIFLFSGVLQVQLLHSSFSSNLVNSYVWCQTVVQFLFFLFDVMIQFFQDHLLKRLSIPHCVFLGPLLQVN